MALYSTVLSGAASGKCLCQKEKSGQNVAFIITGVNGKPMCLVCSQYLLVLKEYKIRDHLYAHHGQKAGVKKKQSVFSHIQETSNEAVKAS